VSRLQDLNVRCHVTAAVNFLDWLAGQGLTLATCSQGDLDRRNSTDASYPAETAHFIRWAVKHKHARDLTADAIRWAGPRGPHDTEKRWDDARRLLHDSALAIQDRVAGLLLLLYAQRIAAITKLTVGDISDDGTTVAITLGTAPIVLPPPLDSLVRELAAARRGHAAIGRPATIPSLFAGGRPGQPITDEALGTRLKNIGLSPLQDRSTALFALATELPAAILARMLGIHISVAVQWQRAAAGGWTAYAADVSRRTAPQPVPSRHETPGRP
jgi:integrase